MKAYPLHLRRGLTFRLFNWGPIQIPVLCHPVPHSKIPARHREPSGEAGGQNPQSKIFNNYLSPKKYVNLCHYVVSNFAQIGILFHIILLFQRGTTENRCSDLSSVLAFQPSSLIIRIFHTHFGRIYCVLTFGFNLAHKVSILHHFSPLTFGIQRAKSYEEILRIQLSFSSQNFPVFVGGGSLNHHIAAYRSKKPINCVWVNQTQGGYSAPLKNT